MTNLDLVRRYRPVADLIEEIDAGYQTALPGGLWDAARVRLEILGHAYAAVRVGAGVFVFAGVPAAEGGHEDLKHLPGLTLAFVFKTLLSESGPDWVKVSEDLARYVAPAGGPAECG